MEVRERLRPPNVPWGDAGAWGSGRGGSLRGGGGRPAVLAGGEPDGMTSSAAPAWNAAVGEGAGCLSISPGPPPPTSRSPRGPRRRGYIPPRRPLPAPALPSPAQEGAETALALSLGSPPPHALWPLSFVRSSAPSARPEWDTKPESSEFPRAAPRPRPAFPWAPGGASPGRVRSPSWPREPRRVQSPRRRRDSPASTASAPRTRAPQLLPGFASPGGAGRGRTRPAAAAAARPGWQPGRVAGPVCAALAAGSAGWIRGRGRGVGAPASCPSPPARGRGSAPSPAPSSPPPRAGWDATTGPGQASLLATPARARRGTCGLPRGGDSGPRPPTPPPPVPRVALGRPGLMNSPPSWALQPHPAGVWGIEKLDLRP